MKKQKEEGEYKIKIKIFYGMNARKKEEEKKIGNERKKKNN